MTFYTNLFSPSTYETFSRSDRTVSGFPKHRLAWAKKVQKGDQFICYMTKLGRWVGVCEIVSEAFVDETPLFFPDGDPYIVRFRVKPIVWLPKELAIPIREKHVWEGLSFTRKLPPSSMAWTGKVRTSLSRISDEDGEFLKTELMSQERDKVSFPVDEDEYRRWLAQNVRRSDKVVSVTVPSDDDADEGDDPVPAEDETKPIRESSQIQALLGLIGEKMGFKVWIPKNDRQSVLKEWSPSDAVMLNTLPLNYNEPTLQTIEQIDVLWLKGRSIARAFEVEHTTAVYSGILRMADLLALQPNMDIKLHIVAPEHRKSKVMAEIQRPVFSLLEKGPLSESCTFIPYGSLRELAQLKHLAYLSDDVLEEYAEGAE